MSTNNKYVPSIFTSITGQNYLAYYLYVRKSLSDNSKLIYDKFISEFFQRFRLLDRPLTERDLNPWVELYLNSYLEKFKNDIEEFPEEQQWHSLIKTKIDAEDVDTLTDNFMAWLNFNRLLKFDNDEKLPLIEGVDEDLYKLYKFNWSFDKAYANSLDPQSTIINIGGLHNAIKYL